MLVMRGRGHTIRSRPGPACGDGEHSGERGRGPIGITALPIAVGPTPSIYEQYRLQYRFR
jgi:hypothetical protein